MTIRIESAKSTSIFEWAKSPSMMKKGYLVFYERDGMRTMRRIEFWDCYCVTYTEDFNHDGEAMINTFELTPGILSINGSKFIKPWRVSNPFTEIKPYEPKEEENKKQKCRIEFKAKNDDLKNGVFGFDWMRDNYKNIVEDYDALKKVYTPIEDIEGKEYFIPWVSIKKGQTITLKVDKDKFKNIDKVTLEGKGFEISPEELQDAKEVHIKCTRNLTEPTKLEVYGDGKLAGAINVWQNQRKTLKLRWVIVEVQGSRSDYDDIESKINKQKLEDYFKKAFNPAMIDVELVNETPEVLDIADLENKQTKENNRNEQLSGYPKRIKECFVEGTKDEIKYDNTAKSNFLTSVHQVYNLQKMEKVKEAAPFEVILYLTNLKCGIITPEKSSYNNGITPRGDSGVSMMLLKNSEVYPETEIPHEIMHACGVPHSFDERDMEGKPKNQEKDHIFKQGRTDNYMDYSNSKQTTWKWQWEKLHQSKFTQ